MKNKLLLQYLFFATLFFIISTLGNFIGLWNFSIYFSVSLLAFPVVIFLVIALVFFILNFIHMILATLSDLRNLLYIFLYGMEYRDKKVRDLIRRNLEEKDEKD